MYRHSTATPSPPVFSITGQKHPLIVHIKRLRTAVGRHVEGAFLVEERELLQRAIHHNVHALCLLQSRGLAHSAEGAAQRKLIAPKEAYSIPLGLMERITSIKPTPTCVATFALSNAPLLKTYGPRGLIQMLDNVVNPSNVGMLMRSAEAAGVDAVVLSGNSSDPWSKRAISGSRGAVFGLPLRVEARTLKVIEHMQTHGVQTVALDAKIGTRYTQIDVRGPTMLIVGNETTGLSPSVLSAVDTVAHIPMVGQISSLNVSVAASLMLYEVLRQRGTIE